MALLAEPVRFRALTPSRPWEETTPEGVRDVVLGRWFPESRPWLRLLAAEVDADSPVPRLAYRFEVDDADGPTRVEQQAFYETADGLITSLTLICSGFR